jgi:hypothetical protein
MLAQQFAVARRFVVEADTTARGADGMDTGPARQKAVVGCLPIRRQVPRTIYGWQQRILTSL